VPVAYNGYEGNNDRYANALFWGKHGMAKKRAYSDVDLNAAKSQMKEILDTLAENGKTIPYSILAKQIGFNHRSGAFYRILNEISSEEDKKKRGMLSAVVVLKKSNIPGEGFFDLARERGRNTRDHQSCWDYELNEVYRLHRGGK
jgi:hypothetical protein